jgi:hypothetical protein
MIVKRGLFGVGGNQWEEGKGDGGMNIIDVHYLYIYIHTATYVCMKIA